MEKIFDDQVQEIEAIVINSDSRVGHAEDRGNIETVVPLEMWVMKKAEIKASLLIVEQLKRIADALEGLDRYAGLAESVRIWGS